MNNLNAFELSILQRISEKFVEVKNHIPFLYVGSRKLTGVGMYINLMYSENYDITGYEIKQEILGTNEYIEMDGLSNGINYEVNASNGMLDFIELVTNGEDWDGQIRDYKFVKI